LQEGSIERTDERCKTRDGPPGTNPTGEQFFSRLGRPGPKGSSHAWVIDETGTLETSGLGMCESEAEQLENSEVNKITVPKEVLKVHGFAPPKKAEGTVRLIYENINGFSN
jgi:hypothetical protein